MAKKITQTGPKGLKGIRRPDLYSGLDNPFYTPEETMRIHQGAIQDTEKAMRAYRGQIGWEHVLDPATYEAQPLTEKDPMYGVVGQSSYDKGLNFNVTPEDIQDIRAQSQSAFNKIAGGIMKGVVLAGTTFLDGTLGLAIGLGTAIGEQRWSGFWDNPFSRAMKEINDGMESLLPNYYTQAEQNDPWGHIFSANFIGDKFLKNLGFTVGAYYSGAIFSGGLGLGVKAPQVIEGAKNFTNASRFVRAALGSGISAVNEGRIEALNNSTDSFRAITTELNQNHQQNLDAIEQEYLGKRIAVEETGPDGQKRIVFKLSETDQKAKDAAIAKENQAFLSAMKQAEVDRTKIGNVDMLLNLPILWTSNLIRFGRLYAGGYSTSRKVGRAVSKNMARAKGVGSALKHSLSEGTEEFSQSVAAGIPADYYTADVMNFYKKGLDPKAKQESLSWIKSAAHAMNEKWNDANAWEEFFIGALTGLVGMPGFRSTRAADGSRQSPIYLQETAYSKYKEAIDKNNKAIALEQILQDRVQSPEFQERLKHFIRQQALASDKENAANRGDHLEFDDAEFGEIINDILYFDNADRLPEYIAAMEASVDTSYEGLRDMAESTTTIGRDGKLVGPYAEYCQINPETGKIEFALTEETEEGESSARYRTVAKTNSQLLAEMRDKVNRKAAQIKDTIENYRKIKDQLDINYGNRLTDEQLSELTTMSLQLSDWQNRASSILEGNKPNLKKLLSYYTQQRTDLEAALLEEGKKGKGEPTDFYKILDGMKKSNDNTISVLEKLLSKSPEVLSVTLQANKNLIDEIIKITENTGVLENNQESFIRDLNDIKTLGEKVNIWHDKLEEYKKSPEQIIQDHIQAEEEAAQEEENNARQALKDKLSAPTTLKELRQVIDEAEESDEDIATALDELEKKGSTLAKNYRELGEYRADVEAAIDQSEESPQAKLDALALFDKLFNESELIEHASNVNSPLLRDTEAFLDDSGTPEEALDRYAISSLVLSEAMNKVNEDNKYKARVVTTGTNPAPVVTPTAGRTVTNPTTGNDSTPTVPVNPVPVQPNPVEDTTTPPAETITSETLLEENRQLARASGEGDISQGNKQYYRPAIPELHIEASKEGDFRPFNEVAKERSNGNLNFDAIYNYLRTQGAFDYVNSGKLKVGDKVGFLIDPAFEEQVEGKAWHTSPTIFMYVKDGDRIQIIGSLDEGRSMLNFEGLSELEERVKQEYQASRTQQSAGMTFSTNYQYDREMSAYGIKGTLDRIENGTAIYVDESGQPVILLAARSDHQFMGIFRESGSDRWSIKMENKEGDRKAFKNMISSAMQSLPAGAKIYERTSISIDGLRVFAQQLNHGFVLGNETYETSINGGDIANVFGLSKEDQEQMAKVKVGEHVDYDKAAAILEPYLEKFGARTKITWDVSSNSIKVTLPVLVKGNSSQSTSTNQSTNQFIATPTTTVAKMMAGKVPFVSTENNLADVPRISDNGGPVLAVVTKDSQGGSTLSIVNRGNQEVNVRIADLDSKPAGRTYLLVSDGTGKYLPVAVRVKHLNRQEFDLNDATAATTKAGKTITTAIRKLATASNQQQVTEAMKLLGMYLHVQDVIVTSHRNQEGKEGILISKKVRDASGQYVLIDDNSSHIKEDKVFIPFSEQSYSAAGGLIGIDPSAYAAMSEDERRNVTVNTTARTTEDIVQHIISVFYNMNLPFQVSTKADSQTIKDLLDAGVFSSNIESAEVRGTWFTTNYIDKEGNEQAANSPASRPIVSGSTTAVGGTESTIGGTAVSVNGTTYHVNLTDNTITDESGNTVPLDNNNPEHSLASDLAYAENVFGSRTQSSTMIDNKIVLPNGKVLNRTTGQYLTGEEAQKVKDVLAGKRREASRERQMSKFRHLPAEVQDAIYAIFENQKRVNKNATDASNYYIQEADGEHPYERVHSVIGSNWLGTALTKKQQFALRKLNKELLQKRAHIDEWKRYLNTIGSRFNIDLSSYYSKSSPTDIQALLKEVEQAMVESTSKARLSAGSTVDTLIRQFFNGEEITKPDNMSEQAFNNLKQSLNGVKENISRNGEIFLANNIVLFHKYQDGRRIAGEVDILAVTRDGNFKIYDVKTSKWSFYPFVNSKGETIDYFTSRSAQQLRSTKDQYTLQLSAYQNLFGSQYGFPVVGLGILPFVNSYDKDNKIANIRQEKGIPITYNPEVAVPLEGAVRERYGKRYAPTTGLTPTTQQSQGQPAVQSTTQPATQPQVSPQPAVQPQVAPEPEPVPSPTPAAPIDISQYAIGHRPAGEVVESDTTITGDYTVVDGYFAVDQGGNLGSTKFHAPMAYIGKIEGINCFVAKVYDSMINGSKYYAVFPNGVGLFCGTQSVGTAVDDTQYIDPVRSALEGNPTRVRAEAAKAPVFNVGESSTVQTPTRPQRTNSRRNLFGSRRRDAEEERVNTPPVWNREQEMAWLDTVLPNLSKEHRVQVVKGLINVAEKGTKAWGMFEDGMMTLSDQAAEGTVYHEAFHVVFNMLLTGKERRGLLEQSRRRFGNNSEEGLEENLAEEFRVFVQNGGEDTRGLGTRIVDFFKSLMYKVLHWKAFQPSAMYYYKRINEGKYADKDFITDDDGAVRLREISLENKDYNELKSDIKRFFANFDIDIKQLSEFDSEEPIFNALERVITFRNAEDLTENAGYAIAFMMQWSPKMFDLASLKLNLNSKVKQKQVRRGLKKRGSYGFPRISDRDWKAYQTNGKYRQVILKEIGKDIANELRKLYLPENTEKTTFFTELWEVINGFFDKMTHSTREKFNVISNYAQSIAHAVKLNDYTTILVSDKKPGTKTTAYRVDIGKAMVDFPYEESIITTLNKYGIALAGSASIAVEAVVMRPTENPLHDIDFNAAMYNKEEIEDILKKEFPHYQLTNTIVDEDAKAMGKDKTTLTYVTMDRPFIIKERAEVKERWTDKKTGEERASYWDVIVDKKTGETLARKYGSDLITEEGVKGKMLDFFIGKDAQTYDFKLYTLNGKQYLFGDSREAMWYKIHWARTKDIWDYNKVVYDRSNRPQRRLLNSNKEIIRKKVEKARIIWAHPAIGKTTYLENNNDILEWDDLLTDKINDFIRSQIDPEHKMDINSTEYRTLKSDYLRGMTPEYEAWLRREWEALKKRASRENKRIFVSLMPVLQMFKDDLDLVVALPEKAFMERELERTRVRLANEAHQKAYQKALQEGKTEEEAKKEAEEEEKKVKVNPYSARSWKQALDKELVRTDPNKVVYTESYFSDFMREALGPKYGTLNEEEKKILAAQGISQGRFDALSRREREQMMECIGFN